MLKRELIFVFSMGKSLVATSTNKPDGPLAIWERKSVLVSTEPLK